MLNNRDGHSKPYAHPSKKTENDAGPKKRQQARIQWETGNKVKWGEKDADKALSVGRRACPDT